MPHGLHSAEFSGVDRCSDSTTEIEHVPAPRRAHRAAPLISSKHLDLSFWTMVRTPRGRLVSSCPFDVPAENYMAGCATGMRVAAEYFAYVREHRLNVHSLNTILEEVFVALRERGNPKSGINRKDRSGAAIGFLCVLKDLLNIGASARSDIGAYVSAWIEQDEASTARLRAKQAASNAEAGRRLQAAKLAKRRGATHV